MVAFAAAVPLRGGTGMTVRKPVRRVVTGHDDQGRAVILSDDADAPNSFSSDTIPGFGATVVWFTPAGAVDHVTDEDPAPAGAQIDFPAVGETVVRIADFPPDAVYPKDAGDTVFDEIGAQEEREAGSEHSGESISGSIVRNRSTTPWCWRARSHCSSMRAKSRCAPGMWRSSGQPHMRGRTELIPMRA